MLLINDYLWHNCTSIHKVVPERTQTAETWTIPFFLFLFLNQDSILDSFLLRVKKENADVWYPPDSLGSICWDHIWTCMILQTNRHSNSLVRSWRLCHGLACMTCFYWFTLQMQSTRLRIKSTDVVFAWFTLYSIWLVLCTRLLLFHQGIDGYINGLVGTSEKVHQKLKTE